MISTPLLDKIFEGAFAPLSPPLTGTELRDSGIQSVLANTPEEYRDRFVSVIKKFPRGHRFTVEEVRELAGEPPDETHPNCIGGLMRSAAKKDLIQLTNKSKPSDRPTRRHGSLAIWRRL